MRTKEQNNTYMRKWRKTEAGRKSRHKENLRSRYGLTLDQYNQMLESQNGVCVICGKSETHISGGTLSSLCVDHDHGTGKIRELLCNNCNRGIGYLMDSPEITQKAADYLKKYKQL